MTFTPSRSLIAISAALLLGMGPWAFTPGHAADKAAAPVPATKHRAGPMAGKPGKHAQAAKHHAPPVAALPDASPEQLEAAGRAHYGPQDCEFNQTIHISLHPAKPGYVDIRHGSTVYTMKPITSSTGALRLEDVKGKTLMLQIANKSMLLDVAAGKRIVDGCTSAEQRLFLEKRQAEEAAAAAAALAASAPQAASAPAATPVPAASSATPASPTPRTAP